MPAQGFVEQCAEFFKEYTFELLWRKMVTLCAKSEIVGLYNIKVGYCSLKINF